MAVMYGLFEFIFSASPDPDMIASKKELDKLKSSLSSSALVISTGRLSDNQLYIIDNTARAWANNPFKNNSSGVILQREKVTSGQEEKDNKKGCILLLGNKGGEVSKNLGEA